MTDSTCGAKKRDNSGKRCKQPAGWGTDHVGEGRCKLHGGNAGAPSSNQNAIKHGLNADPHHYSQSLPQEERQFVEKLAASIEDRVQKYSERVDHTDRILSRQVAIQLHISSKASNYVENESGPVQEVRGQEEAAPLLEEVRKYDNSIFQSLKQLGALCASESSRADGGETWRRFIECEENPE